ncbi:MAG TPA: TonB-dependent receptor [Longimicrobiaceae bacterium]|nr:TonB-dependent receptor [Longimicrobiaceae bacterium]
MNTRLVTLPLRALAAGILVLLPALHPADLHAQEQTGALVVTVTSLESGRPVMGARVALLGTALSATTDATGKLRLAGLPVGLQTVEVRRLGYATRLALVTVHGGEVTSLSMPLEVQAIPVAAIRVEARRRDLGSEYLERAGFDRRRRNGFGAFITRADLEKQRPSFLSDAVRRVAGVRFIPLHPVSRGAYATMARAGGGRNCPIQYFVDGVLIGPGFNIDEIQARDVEGLEIYRGASEIPPEFNRRNAACGVIAVWTRPR